MQQRFADYYETCVDGSFAMAEARPGPMTSDHVLRYQGFEALGPLAFTDHAPAALFLPVIVNFGSNWQIASGGTNESIHDSFMAGLIDRFTRIDSSGKPCCLQIDFTPFGARSFLGQPLHEFSGQVVALTDVLGRQGALFIEQLAALPDWRSRLLHADNFVRARVRRSEAPDKRVIAGWNMLRRSEGRLRVAEMAQRLDCSREHLTRLFKEQAGHAPKTLARIMRFQSARRLAPGLGFDWGAVAHDAGYADQAHFIRDFRQMSGETPTQWSRSHSFNTGDQETDRLT